MDRFEEFTNTYQLLEKLGEGSGGVVYRAYHKRLQKEVVLKEIKSKGLSMADKRQEVDILKNLNHMYLPQVLDFLVYDDEVYTCLLYTAKEAVALARQGDERGYGFLYETTYKSKYYLALQYMKNEEAAQDVLQEAYIRAFTRLDLSLIHIYIIHCDAEVCRRFLEASEGLVKFVGIAPECNPEAVDFIREMKGDVQISLDVYKRQGQ